MGSSYSENSRLEAHWTSHEGEVIKLLKETKPNLRGMCLEEDRFERASGKDCASWYFRVPAPPDFFLDASEVTLWFLLLLYDQKSGPLTHNPFRVSFPLWWNRQTIASLQELGQTTLSKQ